MQDEKMQESVATPWFKTKKGRILWIAGLSLCALILILSLVFLLLPEREPEPVPPTQESTTGEEEMIPGTLAPAPQDDEMRGVYIATVSNLNFPSKKGLSEAELKAELDQIVENSRLIGFDTIYFQVRPSGDALYRSEYFPTSRYITGTEGDPLSFDPLEYLITKSAEFDMQVVAWVNPYRITSQKAETKKEALETLAPTNPARENPDWTVFYDGRLYYDPARSAVRVLIENGVREICRNYKVKGVLFDDYFYPYPVSGQVFDDRYSYTASSSALSLEDWRRENVNQMVKASYEAVKKVNPEMTFGISPFGIWKNSSSDPKGSDTKGMEAYHSIYCDALAWIEGGYVDYLAPQIYWEKGHSAADFDTLVRWWSAQVDGTEVELYISHAAYKVEEFGLGAEEIIQQISFSRSWMGVSGNIQYGYAWIKNNTASLRDRLQAFYADPFQNDYAPSSVQGIVFARPQNQLKTTTSAQFVSCTSDPNYPVYDQFGKVGRTKSGLFSVYMPLNMGNNSITLTQNGVPYTLQVTRVAASTSSQTLPRFGVQSSSPDAKKDAIVASGGSLPVSVTAPAGAVVTAWLGEKSVTLKGTLNPKGEGILKEIYEGDLPAPVVTSGSDYQNAGKIVFSLKYASETIQYSGPSVYVIPASLSVTATVNRDYSHVKVSPTSSFYEDYTPASVGMSDEVTGFVDGYYRLGFGGWVSESVVTVQKGASYHPPRLTSASFVSDEKATSLKLTLGTYPPLNLRVEGKNVTVTLFGASADQEKALEIPEADHLFEKASYAANEKNGSLEFYFTLLDESNYYGMDLSFDNGVLSLVFTQPQSLKKGDLPLEGKTVLVDAGHGGSDPGALGFFGDLNEEQLNLGIALSLKAKLEGLGAKVILSRSEDATVSLYERMDLITASRADFVISIHHNSTGEASDANKTKGTLGLYWAESGKSLASCIQQSTFRALGSYDLGTKKQMLAVCRNHRLPQMLLETSFICSPAEYQNATSSTYYQTVADSIAEGVLNWYTLQESFLGR